MRGCQKKLRSSNFEQDVVRHSKTWMDARRPTKSHDALRNRTKRAEVVRGGGEVARCGTTYEVVSGIVWMW